MLRIRSLHKICGDDYKHAAMLRIRSLYKIGGDNCGHRSAPAPHSRNASQRRARTRKHIYILIEHSANFLNHHLNVVVNIVTELCCRY